MNCSGLSSNIFYLNLFGCLFFVLFFQKGSCRIAESASLDDSCRSLVKTTLYMQLIQHGVMHLQSQLFVGMYFRQHTFVVQLTSLRLVDLTRNGTAGEGTGQLNINPDKGTVVGWNFGRIMDTYGHTHHSIQYNPRTGGTENRHNLTKQGSRDVTHVTKPEPISGDKMMHGMLAA